ncbi:hypothetical protein GHR28_04865 [Escherichia coli]|nr:hypothetical protein [Escherichia coli]ELX1905585.1 hypothetical protein [Escherichia coli]
MTTPITKEHELRVFITGFLTDPAHDEHSENSMTAQVFRIALAAMDAEPVAWVCAHGDEIEYNGHNQFSGGGQGLPLYTAPPAPVVNAEPVADVVAWHKEGEERTCDIRWRRFDVEPGPLFAVAQPVANVPTFDEWLEIRGNKPLGWVKDAMRESYDACRAAMLQGGKS